MLLLIQNIVNRNPFFTVMLLLIQNIVNRNPLSISVRNLCQYETTNGIDGLEGFVVYSLFQSNLS